MKHQCISSQEIAAHTYIKNIVARTALFWIIMQQVVSISY